jgi:hypothetical protein
MNILFRFLTFSILVLTNCTNPFTVRESEIPTDNSDTFENPLLSETVLSNFRYALIQENVSNYEKCFVDDHNSTNHNYRFVHDQRIENERFNNWTLNNEKQYLNTIVNSDSLKSINLTYLDSLSYNSISTVPDSVWTSFNYNLGVTFNDSTYIYKGHSIIKFVKDENSWWYIYYWEDRPTDDNYLNTWSVLKLKFQ